MIHHSFFVLFVLLKITGEKKSTNSNNIHSTQGFLDNHLDMLFLDKN